MNKDALAKACIEAMSKSSLPPKLLIVTPPSQQADNFRIAWDRCATGEEGGRTTITEYPVRVATMWHEPVEVLGFGNMDTCYGRQNVRLNHFLFQRRMEREFSKPMRDMHDRIIEACFFGRKINV